MVGGMLDWYREGTMNEADTCRKYILPNPKSAAPVAGFAI
jgi:hypothetical protein